MYPRFEIGGVSYKLSPFEVPKIQNLQKFGISDYNYETGE